MVATNIPIIIYLISNLGFLISLCYFTNNFLTPRFSKTKNMIITFTLLLAYFIFCILLIDYPTIKGITSIIILSIIFIVLFKNDIHTKLIAAFLSLLVVMTEIPISCIFVLIFNTPISNMDASIASLLSPIWLFTTIFIFHYIIKFSRKSYYIYSKKELNMTLSITILQAFLLIYASGVGLLQIGIPIYSLLFAIVSLLLDIPLFYLLFKIKKNIKANMNYLLLQEEYKKMLNSYKSNNIHEDKIRFLRHDIINYLTGIHHYDSEKRKPL